MKWFGPPSAPFSHACLDTPHAPTPIAACAWCEEPLHEDDYGYLIPHFDGGAEMSELAYHHECWQRQLIGSVGHINRRCSCYGGTEEDPPELTRREAASAACRAFAERMQS